MIPMIKAKIAPIAKGHGDLSLVASQYTAQATVANMNDINATMKLVVIHLVTSQIQRTLGSGFNSCIIDSPSFS